MKNVQIHVHNKVQLLCQKKLSNFIRVTSDIPTSPFGTRRHNTSKYIQSLHNDILGSPIRDPYALPWISGRPFVVWITYPLRVQYLLSIRICSKPASKFIKVILFYRKRFHNVLKHRSIMVCEIQQMEDKLFKLVMGSLSLLN